MTPTLVNGWWLSTDTRIGTSDTSGVTSAQETNAQNIYNYFSALGWSLSAICGMLGNMQVESYLSPAYIQSAHRSQLPNSAASLSDVPNSVMLNFYGGSNYGVGLVQWDGYTTTPPVGQKLVSFAERYGLDWYDGDTQCFRIQREQETNLQWTTYTLYGTSWTWNNYVSNTRTPEDSAAIFQKCYEKGGTDTTRRKNNARYWYDYFSGTPPTPPEPGDDWIPGTDFSDLATAYDPDITGVQIPYSQMDCITYVQTVWQDIQAVSSSDTLCSPLGTNTLWRTNTSQYPNLVRTFNTTSPDNQNPTPVLWWKGTISDLEDEYGSIPPGTLLLHKIGENDNPPIPNQYRGDGIGNFAHIGIYIGNGQVMQSGGRDSSSVPGGGVHRSAYDSSAWNYAAFVVWVDPTGGTPTPPGPDVPLWFFPWYTMVNNNRKGVVKLVRR